MIELGLKIDLPGYNFETEDKLRRELVKTLTSFVHAQCSNVQPGNTRFSLNPNDVSVQIHTNYVS